MLLCQPGRMPNTISGALLTESNVNWALSAFMALLLKYLTATVGITPHQHSAQVSTALSRQCTQFAIHPNFPEIGVGIPTWYIAIGSVIVSDKPGGRNHHFRHLQWTANDVRKAEKT